MQYTDNEAALIGGLISTYFFQPAVSASLKDAYSRVLEHLHQNALTSSDLQQIRKAVNFLMQCAVFLECLDSMVVRERLHHLFGTGI